MKKLLALLLAVAMVAAVFAGCKEAKPNTTNAPTNPNGPETPVVENYTYTDWVTTLSANWNPHTYETNDQAYPIDFLTAGLYTFVFNDDLHPVEGKEAYEGYKIIPEMAAEMPVDVTEAIKASHPQFNIPENATAGYAYTIALNPNACWEDGTKITADDYIESMKRLLDPRYKNYRANGYYEGSFDITGAEEYANQGALVPLDNGATKKYSMEDLVKGEDGVYATSEGFKIWIPLTTPLSQCSDYSITDLVAMGYLDAASLAGLEALADENGNVAVTDESIALVTTLIDTENWGHEPPENVPLYIMYDFEYEDNYDFSNVGLFKSGEYELTLVLDKSLIGFTLWYNLTGNWLVKTDLYDSCMKETKNEDGTSVWTSTYNTSVETTCSYGPYKMTDYQTDKGMHFVKNDKWYGYTDEAHKYVHSNGKVYSV